MKQYVLATWAVLATATVLSVLPALTPAAEAATTGIVTGRIYTSGDSTAPLNFRQLQDLKNIGVNTIRVEFEDRDGQDPARVTAYKNVIKWSGQLGIKVIGVLTFASMGDQSLPPGSTASVSDFDSRFVPKFLSTFDWHNNTYGNVDSTGYGVEGWEIWNEPDVYLFKRGTAFMGEEFALLNVRVYETRKPSIGTRKIFMGGPSRMDDDNLLRAIYDSTPIRNFQGVNGQGKLPGDYMAIHGYGSTQTPATNGYSWQGGTFKSQIDFMFSLKDALGYDLIPKTVPIVMTEVGYGTKSPMTEASQASGLNYVLNTLKLYPQFDRVLWYDYRDDEVVGAADPRGGEWFGLRNVPQSAYGNGGVKASYNTYANFNGKPGIAQTALGSGTNSLILAAFNRNDTANNNVGHPFDNGGGSYVHVWGNGNVQDFSDGAFEGGKGSIGYLNGEATAGYVYGNFWSKWLNNGGAGSIGYPFHSGVSADRHAWNTTGATGMVQDFKGGSNGQGQIQQESGSANVFYISGAIFTKYLNSGSIGTLGYATSDAYASGTQTRQDFRYGYILYTPSTSATQAWYGGAWH
jgi:hypothetical protein